MKLRARKKRTISAIVLLPPGWVRFCHSRITREELSEMKIGHVDLFSVYRTGIIGKVDA